MSKIVTDVKGRYSAECEVLDYSKISDEYGKSHNRLVAEYNQHGVTFVRDHWEDGIGWSVDAVINVSDEHLQKALNLVKLHKAQIATEQALAADKARAV